MEDHYTGYSELLVNGLERMLKQLNQRKYRQIQESIKKAIEQVKSEKGAPATELDANKYFPIFEKCLETKITKVLEAGLYYIQKLVSHGYVNGKQAQMEPIIKAICSCAYQIDDNVQLQVIKCLLTMVTSLTCEVHGNSLIEGFQACYHIHISSKNVINQTTAKGALTQMLSVVFQRMESNTLAENPQAYYKFYEGQQFYGEEELSESALYRSLSALVKNMVDDVQMYQAKMDQYPDDVHYIPLRSVPFVMNPDDPCFSKLKVVYIQNELNKVSGKFGWCVVCRNTADLYCKDTRDPICSKRCKDLHMKNLQDADQ